MSAAGARRMSAEYVSEIAQRAGWFTSANIAGRNADKNTAQRFGISVRMAQLLRRGEGWTLHRLEQAQRIFGPVFGQMVFGPLAAGGGEDALAREIADVRQRLDLIVATWLRGPLHVAEPADSRRDDAVDRGVAVDRGHSELRSDAGGPRMGEKEDAGAPVKPRDHIGARGR